MTIHLIFNAHIDPVWLWPWQAGLDEVLATCQSACDRLDTHADLIFTRGEAWAYRQIERTDPELFARIRQHVIAGRWEIVGGWWLQPDCNLPSGSGMKKQIELGKSYFEDTFGTFPRIAYNVDSFGHAATLPGLMHSFGQDRYVMMRPRDHELHLPARLFRWRGYEDGPEVITFRIANSYTSRELLCSHLEASLTGLPEGVQDTMCFVGVGDHGGGPTETQIAWCREQMSALPGHRLIFSSPRRFFDAIQNQVAELPVVMGELQQHAIGCYSVYRPIKMAVQTAEHALDQAETLLHRSGVADIRTALDEDVSSLHLAWQRVCFAHFHDTLAGTCLPSAYEQELDRLGFARSVADETTHIALRRLLCQLPDDKNQRIVLYNASDQPFTDFVEFEPWLEWQQWDAAWMLFDHTGAPVPFQVIAQEALAAGSTRLLFRPQIEPNECAVIRIAPDKPMAGAAVSRATFRAALTPDSLLIDGIGMPLPSLHLIEDNSDTWSHGLDRFGEDALQSAQWNLPVAVDGGPLMNSWMQCGHIGESSLQAEWRVYAEAPFVELRLRVNWREQHRLLKLVWQCQEELTQRCDGISGGRLVRPNDGRELPLRDWSCLLKEDGTPGNGVVCPDVFALDVTAYRVRLTLLRSALMAHHEPHSGEGPRRVFSDQGQHLFRFRFYTGTNPTTLDATARMLHQPPIAADLTRGMPAHISES